MSYSDFGLDDKKLAQDPDSKVREWSCLWCNSVVKDGFNLCFSNWVICRDCVETAHESERWTEGVECWKCSTKDIKGLGCDPAWGLGEYYVCQPCIEWAKETFSKQDEFINKEREQMTTEEILQQCTVHGNNIKLPENLLLDHKSEYTPLKKVLEKAGGRWIGRDVSAFVFKSDPSDILNALQVGEKPQKLFKADTAESYSEIESKLDHARELVNKCEIDQATFNEAQSHKVPADLKQSPLIIEAADGSNSIIDDSEKLTISVPALVQDTLLQPSEKLTKIDDMNFFIQLAALLGQAEISLTVKAKDENLTVMIMPKGATQLDKVKPLILSGSAADLDQEFFTTVAGSIRKMSGIVSNVEEYEKSLDDTITKAAAKPAKSRSKSKAKDEATAPVEAATDEPATDPAEVDRIAAEEAASAAEAKAAEEKKEKYSELMERASELISEKSFSMALQAFESAKEFTEDVEALEGSIEACKQDMERTEKFNTLLSKSQEFATSLDWKNAAGALKQARTLSDDPDSHDKLIKEYMQKALEAEMAAEAPSYL